MGQFVQYCQLLLSFVLTGGISLSIVFLPAFLGHSWGQILYSFTLLQHLDVNNYSDVNHVRSWQPVFILAVRLNKIGAKLYCLFKLFF